MVEQKCSYSGTLLNAAAQKCVFEDTFKELVTVEVSIDTALVIPELAVYRLDNIVHTNTY